MDPTNLVAAVKLIRTQDVLAIARSVLMALDTMRPIPVPPMPVPSDELCALLDKRTPGSVPEHMQAEFSAYEQAMLRRYNARAENERRLRTSLWAEQCLRERGDAEHIQIRRFNRDQWGMTEPAAADVSLRWAQSRNMP